MLIGASSWPCGYHARIKRFALSIVSRWRLVLLQETPELVNRAQNFLRDLNGLLEDDRISPEDHEAIKALVCKWRFAHASEATSAAI